MKLLLDENLSHRLRPLLVGHEVFSVQFMGWKGVENGELLSKAAAARFDALVTMDLGIQYEQNLASLPCSVVLLKAESNAIEHLRPLVPELLRTLNSMPRRSLVHVEHLS